MLVGVASIGVVGMLMCLSLGVVKRGVACCDKAYCGCM